MDLVVQAGACDMIGIFSQSFTILGISQAIGNLSSPHDGEGDALLWLEPLLQAEPHKYLNCCCRFYDGIFGVVRRECL